MADEYVIDSVMRRIRVTEDPKTTAPEHPWNDPDGDGHGCVDCPDGSIWACDRIAHRMCECDATDDQRYHGGSTEGCPRQAADHSPVVSSPALCLPCLHGCAE